MSDRSSPGARSHMIEFIALCIFAFIAIVALCAAIVWGR
jgi:hypothetical protein